MPPAVNSGEVPLLATDLALLLIYARHKITIAISYKINYIASREWYAAFLTISSLIFLTLLHL